MGSTEEELVRQPKRQDRLMPAVVKQEISKIVEGLTMEYDALDLSSLAEHIK
jgi:hypothetical protein